MALQLSTGLRNLMLGGASFREAFADSVLVIFSGNAPAASGNYGAADITATGTRLVEITKAGVTVTTQSTPQMAKITCGGTTQPGTYGLDITGASGALATYSVVNDGNANTTALALAEKINRDCPDFMAAIDAASPVIFLVARSVANVGAVYTIAPNPSGSGNTTAVTNANLHTFAASAALQFGLITTGAIAKQSAAWSGTAIASGTAGYWRLVRSIESGLAQSQSLTAIRLQGTCGVGSGDILMSTTAIVTGASQTVDSFSIELPATI